MNNGGADDRVEREKTLFEIKDCGHWNDSPNRYLEIQHSLKHIFSLPEPQELCHIMANTIIFNVKATMKNMWNS